MVAAEDPAVGGVHVGGGSDPLRRRGIELRSVAKVTQHVARRLPDLVAKVAVGLHPARRQPHVVARSRAGEQGEAQGILTVLVDDVQGVVAPGVGHRLADLFSLLVADQAVQVDDLKGHLIRHRQA